MNLQVRVIDITFLLTLVPREELSRLLGVLKRELTVAKVHTLLLRTGPDGFPKLLAYRGGKGLNEQELT